MTREDLTEQIAECELSSGDDILVRCIINLMDGMDDKLRMVILRQFCCYCGSQDPGCQCWNDE